MSFGTLLPLIFLVGVPVIIILYLMRPKGTKKVIPSVMLWKNAERNEKSVTFSRKLIRNILMFLEIAALLFLMFAAMSPVIKRKAQNSFKKSVIIIDTTGSMQFMSDGKETRFEKAIKDAVDYVDSASGEISVIASGKNSELLINSSRDKQRIKRTLRKLKCQDTTGDLNKTEGLIRTLDVNNVAFFTDGTGAAELSINIDKVNMEVFSYGVGSDNVALTQMSMKKKSSGLYDIALGYNVFSEYRARFDLSVYDGKDNLLEVRTIDTGDSPSGSALMTDKEVEGSYVRGEITGITFYDKSSDVKSVKDGLIRDNTAYAVTSSEEDYDAYFVGVSNVYLERAYKAATGNNVIKVGSDSEIGNDDKKKIAIYDNDALVTSDFSRIVMGAKEGAEEKIDGAMVNVRPGELMTDIGEFSFGSNELSVLSVPDWGHTFMYVTDKAGEERAVAYYGEHDSVREIVLGFDIRNSEFPLMAEFPIFITDAVGFLTDESMVKDDYIEAGDMVTLSPSLDESLRVKASDLTLSGIYNVGDEYFVVRYPVTESNDITDKEATVFSNVTDYGVRLSSLKQLCLILAFILLLADWIIYAFRSRAGFGVEFLVRVVLLLIILFAALGINLPGRKKKTATVFVVDLSDSSKQNLERSEEYLRKRVAELPSGEVYAVVTFGKDALTDQFITDEKNFLQIATAPSGIDTDIEGAVGYAASLLPDERSGRIVLLTDGKETLGDINNTSDLIRENDIEICAYIYDDQEIQDVYVQSVDMPEKLYSGDGYKLKTTVYSTYDTDAELKVWDGSKEKSSSKVHLTAGENTFVFDEVAGDKSIEERHVTVEASGDNVEQNNDMVAGSIVDVSRKVLLVSGLSTDSSGFDQLLKSINVETTVVSANNAPDSLVGMLGYKTIILDDASIKDLPEGFINNIESYVKDYGGGLITTGGTESYAPGGYRDSILETVLPVNMTPKGIDESPSQALVMVIDCSGSMESTVNDKDSHRKIDIAVAAANEAVENLRDRDYVGVVTFSDSFEWRQPLTKVEDKDEIMDAIDAIGIQGGTVIKPAVIEAADKLSKVDTGTKHIILLTDGEGETKDFSDAVKKINDNNITLSSIAVGTDSDKTLLEQLAKECGGRYYYSENASDVPKIFTEEVYLSGDTYYKNGDYELELSAGNKLLEGLYSEGVPHISGYIGTSTKNGAREVIISSEEDPILSYWQYGLGTTASWTTNSSGSWNEGLAGMDDYAEMWKRMLDLTEIQSQSGSDSLSMVRRRGKLEVSYYAAQYSDKTKITAVYNTPSGESGNIMLTSSEPGKYTGSFDTDEMGIYAISVTRKEGDEFAAGVSAIETVQFSDEYRKDISNQGFINFVEQNGRILDDNTKLYTKLKTRNRSKKNISYILIVIAIFLLITDIVIRRFDLVHRFKNRHSFRKNSLKEIEDKNKADKNKAEKPAKKKKVKAVEEKKKEEASEDMLDTSALLKKKSDRNL